VLEPGCGIGNFLTFAPPEMRFVGVELDSISGRIARQLHPGHDIRIENFRDTKLPENRIDAVIGNVPFADLKLDYRGQKLSLHDYFFAKSIDALKPGGVRTVPSSRRFAPSRSPTALSGDMTVVANFAASSRIAATRSGVASSKPGSCATWSRPASSVNTNRMSARGAW